MNTISLPSQWRQDNDVRRRAGASLGAVLVAMALAACGPRAEVAPVAPSTAVPATSPAVAPAVAVPTEPARAGTPVPPVAVAAAPTTAPAYAPTPQNAPVPTPMAQDGPASPSAAPPAAPAPVARNRIGSVVSIEPIRERPQGSGAGAVVGGVLGAVVGNQFGHGTGRAAMTGVGAVGGAIAGNNVERNYRKTIVGYRVHVRLDNGNERTFERTSLGNLHVGDRVRLDGNALRRV